MESNYTKPLVLQARDSDGRGTFALTLRVERISKLSKSQIPTKGGRPAFDARLFFLPLWTANP
jgi:hypothetical protein